ncbi:MAG: Ldh family oxidoreductase [Gammaproteobacteria bacterium]|nr:Ldh family oxidoreductase [Gammaproteobacteria bacterium]
MLDQFTVPDDIAQRVDADLMRHTVEAVFIALGMPTAHARQSADVLMYADLRGYDTHGVSNMLRVYVDWIRDGTINLTPQWSVMNERSAMCLLDADGAHGGVVGPHAMSIAIEKAKASGVGVVNVYNGGHYGAAAYTAAMALEHDFIGLSMTVGGLGVTPTFAAEKLVGLNPIAIAVPAKDEPPFVFDASMSGVAGNKIRIAERLGRGTLPGWIAAANGAPIMEAAPIPEGFMHLPLGGTRSIGSHKGFGLAMMIEVLCSALSGAAAGPERRARQSQQLICYDVAAFTDTRQFKDDMDVYLKRLRTAKPAPDAERVLYPGLNAHAVEQDRRAKGIPYHPEVLAWFDSICLELNIDNPLPVADPGTRPANVESDLVQEQARQAFGVELTAAQSARAKQVARGVRRVLDATAASSLFDTEPSNLDATLTELADEEGTTS